MEIKDTVALITGTRRIGSVVAVELARRGADVVLGYNRSQEEAEAAAKQIRTLGRKALSIQADVSKVAEVQNLVGRVIAELGRLDVLVNMASIYRSKPFIDTTEQDWDANLNVNLKSAFLCAQAVAPVMKENGGGRIINFADWIAASGRPRYKGFVPYYVSKAGIVGLTESLALELASDQILVNAIAPGPILAPPDLTEEEDREVRKATPVGRWGGEMEIAKVVVSLIETDFITGECIRVDGGRHVH
ncbi:MAG: SDR family oxidoreductase [Acidobacteria bacterium]|nr:SDR family oxidoreductase [Acidobacteriota bacterium]